MNVDEEVTISVSGTATEDRFPVPVHEEHTANPNAVFTTDSTESKTAVVEPENLRIVISKPEQRSANVTVHDVAAFIVNRQGEMSAMKLQKLVYYSQAWSLVWDDEPLFDDAIEAWANGPVVRALYARHRGQFKVS